jgi:hypothetical protein
MFKIVHVGIKTHPLTVPLYSSTICCTNSCKDLKDSASLYLVGAISAYYIVYSRQPTPQQQHYNSCYTTSARANNSSK